MLTLSNRAPTAHALELKPMQLSHLTEVRMNTLSWAVKSVVLLQSETAAKHIVGISFRPCAVRTIMA